MPARIQIKPTPVSTIRRLLEKRIFAVPEIQREFVWNPQRVCALLDSLYHEYPVGSVMVWRTKKGYSSLVRHKLHILPHYNPKGNSEIYFLIDGQQRLSVLYQVINGGVIRNYARSEIDFSNFYFSFRRDAKLRFEYLKRPDAKVHFRVKDILDRNWQYHFRKISQGKKKSIRDCRNRLLAYQLPVIYLRTNDIDEVRETFVRINSQGMKISKADHAFARAAKFDLRHATREIRDSLQYGFSRLSDSTVLTCLSLAHGGDNIGERVIEDFLGKLERNQATQAQFRKNVRKLKTSMGLAVDHLVGRMGVASYDFLPSENMVATLALFFFHNRNAQPDKRQRDEIRKWFWATAVGQRYSGNRLRPSLRSDIRFFQRLGSKKRGHFTLEERIPRHVLRSTEYNTRNSIADAFRCMLVLNKPRHFENGEEIRPDFYASQSNRKELHHIFPRAYMRRIGVRPKLVNSIGNICLLPSRENKSFRSQPPVKYLEDHKRKRHFRRALRSHLIPYGKDAYLLTRGPKRDFRKFLDERCALIASEFESLAGTKLFAREP